MAVVVVVEDEETVQCWMVETALGTCDQVPCSHAVRVHLSSCSVVPVQVVTGAVPPFVPCCRVPASSADVVTVVAAVDEVVASLELLTTVQTSGQVLSQSYPLETTSVVAVVVAVLLGHDQPPLLWL